MGARSSITVSNHPTLAAAARIGQKLEKLTDYRQPHEHSEHRPSEMDVLECATDGRHALHVACVIARIIGDSRQRASWMQLGRPDVEADRAVSIEPPSDLRARTAILGDIERRTRREV